jgi:3-oxoacyl-[acyl-carrier-protein] synthase II
VVSELFINGTGIVSPQKTLDNASFLEEIVTSDTGMMKCQEPNYKEFIPADQVRRMARIIRMGVASAKLCLSDAGCQVPDMIVSGTGLGCIEDTEKFLMSMIRNNEELLTPTSFIQSTHNTVSAQIALLLKCHGYNFTFVHRGWSFEHALIDAFLLADSSDNRNILAGGVDELTANTFAILQRLGQVKTPAIHSADLLTDKKRGSIPGEGAAFFLLNPEQSEKSYARLRGVQTFFRPKGPEETGEKIRSFLASKGLGINDIDLVISGRNGDPVSDAICNVQFAMCLKGIPELPYKQLCGEYFTSSTFALWLAAKILKHQSIPTAINSLTHQPADLRTILIWNHYRNIDHSLILVRKA